MKLTIGIDIGGTKIAGGVIDESGRILQRARVDTPAGNAEEIEAAVVQVTTSLAVGRRVSGVGVSAAGFVDASRSTILFAPNLAWRDVPLRRDLEQALRLPVVVENDGNAAAWGEFTHGAAEDADDLLMVAVGTGVGGGVVADGQLVRGAFGIAGEIGHVRVVRDGRPCPCGLRGCLEQYASGSALEADTRAAAAEQPEAAGALISRAGGAVDLIDGPMITELAHAGDAFCRERLAELGQWLGEGVASIAAVLDPAVVVIGGGVCAAGDHLLDPLRVALASQLTGHGHRPVAEVRTAMLGNDAGLIGAAALATA